MFVAQAAVTSLQLSGSIELGGSSHLPRHFTSIRDEIEINLLVLRDGPVVLAFLSLDTLFVGEEVMSAAKVALAEYFGVQAKLIAFASHSHNAPMLDRSKPLLGETNNSCMEHVKHKIANLFQKVSQSKINVASTTKVVALGSHGVNRRLTRNIRLARHGFRSRRKTFMAPNMNGSVDNSIKCLLLRNENEDVVAALIQVACHPTSYPDRFTVTADYIEKLRTGLRKLYHHSLPVIFLQGFSGDVRPNCQMSHTIKTAFRQFISGPGFRQPTREMWESWSDNIFSSLSVALLQQQEFQPLIGRISVTMNRVELRKLLTGYEGDASLEVVHFNIGENVSGVAVNAEMLTGWLESTEQQFFTASCANDTFGYLPDQESVTNLGYEVEGFMRPFGLKAVGWKKGYDKMVSAALSNPSSIL